MGLFSRKPSRSDTSVQVENDWPFGAKPGFVVFDIETTGLSPTSDRLIEIALIRTDQSGNPLAYWSSLVNPNQPVGATEIHGISDADVASSPAFDDVIDDILRRIRGQALSAHNAQFDMSFLQVELARSGWELPKVPVLCTMQESRHFIPGLSKRRLQDCISALGVGRDVEHRALGDATLTTTLVNFYLNGPTNKERSQKLMRLPDEASKVAWSTSKTFPMVPQGRSTQKNVRAKVPQIPSIAEVVSSTMPEDLLGDEAPGSELAYAQVLLETMEDGVISDEEYTALGDLAGSLPILESSQKSIHEKLMMTLAHEAWRDGSISRAEQSEIIEIGRLLGFTETESKGFIKQVEDLRAARIGARSKALPDNWDLGRPLYVGDRIVITGCYSAGREELESKSKKMGLKVTGAVSGKTTLLVSDGTVNGNKDSDAAKLGIRSVSPEIFLKLLEYVQPAQVDEEQLGDGDQIMLEESLICTKCGETFKRKLSKGRKPHFCTHCR